MFVKIVLAYEHIRRLRGTTGEWVTAVGGGLAARGHEVHILCDSVADASLCPELTFHARRPFVKGESHRLLVLRKWALRQLGLLGADVNVSFHAAVPAEIVLPIQGFVGTRLAKEFRLHRNPFWGMCLQMWPPVNERRLVEWLLRRDRRRVQVLGATSRLMRDNLLERCGKDEDRVRLVAGASAVGPSDESDVEREEMRAALGLTDDAVVFLWAGNRMGWHGVRYLVEAFGKLVNGGGNGIERARLVLACEGQSTLHRWALQHGCAKQVLVVGRTNKLERLLAACDVGVNPAVLSHLGRFTWECLAFGKPMICSADTAGVDRMVGDDQRRAGRVVRPYDVVTLRQGLVEMLDDALRESATKVAEGLAGSMAFDLFLDRFENLLHEQRGMREPHAMIGSMVEEEANRNGAYMEGDEVGARLPIEVNSISAAGLGHVDDEQSGTMTDE